MQLIGWLLKDWRHLMLSFTVAASGISAILILMMTILQFMSHIKAMLCEAKPQTYAGEMRCA